MLRLEVDRLIVLALCGGAVVAALTIDPGGWWQSILLVALAVLICVDQAWLLPVPVVTGALVVGMLAARWAGDLEPGMFLLSVFAVLLTSSRDLDPWVASGVVLLLAVPLVLVVVNGADETAAVWMLGIGTPAAMGWAGRRQVRLGEELAAARTALSEQQLVEDRRRIARDVHDLVGHGLAATLVQVASARHVLRRDPDAADEALRVAEAAGRASLRDLRATLAALRDGTEGATSLPGLADVETLVATSTAAGLDVRLLASGDLTRVGAAAGLSAYRICQEALTNATRHAPGAPTEVSLAVGDGSLRLRVLSRGVGASGGAGGFGLVGMRERATAVGGELRAGPTADGWLVDAALPTGESLGEQP